MYVRKSVGSHRCDLSMYPSVTQRCSDRCLHFGRPTCLTERLKIIPTVFMHSLASTEFIIFDSYSVLCIIKRKISRLLHFRGTSLFRRIVAFSPVRPLQQSYPGTLGYYSSWLQARSFAPERVPTVAFETTKA